MNEKRIVTQEEITNSCISVLAESRGWLKVGEGCWRPPSFEQIKSERKTALAARPWYVNRWQWLMLLTWRQREYFRILGLAIIGRAQDMEQW